MYNQKPYYQKKKIIKINNLLKILVTQLSHNRFIIHITNSKASLLVY